MFRSLTAAIVMLTTAIPAIGTAAPASDIQSASDGAAHHERAPKPGKRIRRVKTTEISIYGTIPELSALNGSPRISNGFRT